MFQETQKHSANGALEMRTVEADAETGSENLTLDEKIAQKREIVQAAELILRNEQFGEEGTYSDEEMEQMRAVVKKLAKKNGVDFNHSKSLAGLVFHYSMRNDKISAILGAAKAGFDHAGRKRGVVEKEEEANNEEEMKVFGTEIDLAKAELEQLEKEKAQLASKGVEKDVPNVESQGESLEEKVKASAMGESRNYFQKNFEKAQWIFRSRDVEIQTFFKDAMDAESTGGLTVEHVQALFREDGISKDMAQLLLDTFKEIEPITRFDSASDIFKQKILDKLDPRIQLKSFEKSYDDEKGYYFEHADGQKAHAEMRARLQEAQGEGSEENKID